MLNLPRRVTQSGQLVKYYYDAAGAKRQVVAPSGVQTTYEGAFEYNANGTLARIGLEEGQLLRDALGSYSVQYYLKDHLGNTRLVLKEDGNVSQRTEYYGFGLPIFKDTSSVATNKYLYNGKEQQPQTKWFDYGARMYDPTIGRWMTIDPLSEQSRRWSPYNYVYNNPLRFIDPDGMEGRDVFGNVTFNGYAGIGEGGYIEGNIRNDSPQGNDSGSGNTGQSSEAKAEGSGPGPVATDGFRVGRWPLRRTPRLSSRICPMARQPPTV